MIATWPIHTLVFDLDDTLYAERDYVLSGFRAADKYLETKFGARGFATEATFLLDQGERGTIFNKALPRVGVPDAPETVTALIEAYRTHQPTLRLAPDATSCLAWAGERFQLALITDGYSEVQKRKIAALGLEERIDCRIVTDLMGREYWKPNPTGFRRVMAELPGPVSGYVYIADNPRKDFIAPRSLGWRTVRVRREGGEHSEYENTASESAERDVRSLCEIESFIQPVRVDHHF